MTAKTPLRLLIAEDQAILRAALCMFFSERDGIVVVGEATNSDETLRLHKQFHPHILLLSTNIRPTNILMLMGALCQENADTRIVVLASNFNETPFENFMAAGATIVVEEGIFASDLFTVIQDVYYQG